MAQPTAEEQKYDRQLRLWGSGGQSKLRQAKLCLLNASGVGTEALKNLVLPGVGSFTIVDGATTREVDLGTTFFLTPEDLGHNRGDRAMKWLLEMNSDVSGNALNQDPIRLIEENVEYFTSNDFTLVIATQIPEASLVKLSTALRQAGICLLAARSVGLVGYLRLQSPDCALIDTLPDQVPEDLRLMRPFPELTAFVESLPDPDTVDDGEKHAHYPFVGLILFYLKQWKEKNGFTGDSLTYAQRKEVLKEVWSHRRVVEGSPDEENFGEAQNAQNKMNLPDVPSGLKKLMADPEAQNLTEKSDPFWFCMNALKRYFDSHGVMPLSGKLTDMTSTTEWYVALQQAYSTQAKRDVEEIAGYVAEACKRLSGEEKTPPEIGLDFITAFCKNVWGLRYLKVRSVAEEVNSETCHKDTISKIVAGAEEGVAMGMYLAMRAGDRFLAAHGRVAGDGTAPLDNDSVQLEALLRELCKESGITLEGWKPEDFATEWVRYGGGELHTVSAVLGGIVAQESIKLITMQRVPINNTLVYNAMEGSMPVWEL